jgi:hypothetical protein
MEHVEKIIESKMRMVEPQVQTCKKRRENMDLEGTQSNQIMQIVSNVITTYPQFDLKSAYKAEIYHQLRFSVINVIQNYLHCSTSVDQ